MGDLAARLRGAGTWENQRRLEGACSLEQLVCRGRGRRSAWPRGKASGVLGVSLRGGAGGCLWPACLPQALGAWKLGEAGQGRCLRGRGRRARKGRVPRDARLRRDSGAQSRTRLWVEGGDERETSRGLLPSSAAFRSPGCEETQVRPPYAELRVSSRVPEACAHEWLRTRPAPGTHPVSAGRPPVSQRPQGPEGPRELPAPAARAPGLTREVSDGATRAGLEKGGASAKPPARG